MNDLFLDLIKNKSLFTEEEYNKIVKVLPNGFDESYEIY